MFRRSVRRTAAGLLPLHADSFVHAVALATVVALTLMQFIPLIVLRQPPLLEFLTHLEQYRRDLELNNPDLLKSSTAAYLMKSTSPNDQSFLFIASLIWLVPSAVLAVGFPFVRTIRESLVRVGLVRPSWTQVLLAVAAAMVMAVVMTQVDHGISALWKSRGWPTTDDSQFEKLMEFAMSASGAVMVGIVAGLGEEIFVRGVLQPRLGIVLSNLFFTSAHALQYHWDGLISVFLAGLVLGVIRKKTNTTTSAIVHGTYDFMLLLWSLQ